MGPRKLPELARQLGRGLNELQRASYEMRRTLEEEARVLTDPVDDFKRTVKSAADITGGNDPSPGTEDDADSSLDQRRPEPVEISGGPPHRNTQPPEEEAPPRDEASRPSRGDSAEQTSAPGDESDNDTTREDSGASSNTSSLPQTGHASSSK